MELKVQNKSNNIVTLDIKNASIPFLNSIRRIITTEVPVLSIDTCEFRVNDSALYDEIIAHRLGLLVLKTDLKSFTIPKECSCEGEGCAKCQLVFTLKAKGDKIVYASDLKSQDPKLVPVHENTIIVKLLKGQNIELQANAVLGQGINHMKWSPAHVYYKNRAKITVNNSDIGEFKDKYPEQIFDAKGQIDKNKIIELDLIDACDGINDDIVKVDYDESNILFVIENWGQLDTSILGVKAAEILEGKCDDFIEKLKNAEVS